MTCGPNGEPCGGACCEDNPLQPDTDEVLQLEPMSSVPVRLDGPVRTQALPTKGASTRTVQLTTTPILLLRANHWRKNVKLVGIAQAFLFAFNKASASDPSTMAQWPIGVPYTCEATTEIWVAAATGTTALSVVTENWAAGK